MIARFRTLLTLLLAAALPHAATAQLSTEGLIEAMQQGGTVIFLRHAATDESEIDTGRLGDRAGQRNLSSEGREQARALGRALRALGVPLDRILASPVFRSRDTAEIAFGPDEVEVTMDLVADDYAGTGLRRMLAATARLLAAEPPAGTNLLLTGHRTPLETVTGQPFPDSVLPEGAMAVFRPEDGGARLLGTLSAEELVGAAGN